MVQVGAPQAAEAVGHTARWTRLAALGLLMEAIAPLLMLGAALLWGLDVGGDAAFFAVPGVVGLVAAFLAYRFGTWAKIVGIVVALLIAMMLFWTVFGLFSPRSFFDFVPGLLVIPGALIAVASCVGAIVAGRRGHRADTAIEGERRTIRIVLTALVVLAALSATLSIFGRSTADESQADTVVTLKDFEFNEASYEFEQGSTVLVRNNDPFIHSFTIEALDIDETLTPGSEKLIEIPERPGAYVVFCRPHTSDAAAPDVEEDMAAEVTIR
jgi:plastocyanin